MAYKVSHKRSKDLDTTIIKGILPEERHKMTDDWEHIPMCIDDMLKEFHKSGTARTLSISFKVTKGREVPYYQK